MDQEFLSGIGNLYSSEICFYARVSPLRYISKLTKEEITFLFLKSMDMKEKNVYAAVR